VSSTFKISLPKFMPCNSPVKALGAFSRPATMSSLYFILLLFYQALIWLRQFGRLNEHLTYQQQNDISFRAGSYPRPHAGEASQARANGRSAQISASVWWFENLLPVNALDKLTRGF
jgi:hypothetical protein